MFASHATRAERTQPLPGDELLPETATVSTHAITIEAPRESIWPWLAQMGCDRAGWYSYDRLDNAGRPSAASIQPELQEIRVGQILPSQPGSSDAFELLRLEPPELLLLGAYFRLPALQGLPWNREPPNAFVRSTWGFYLREADAGTRLIVRSRTIFRPRWAGYVIDAVMGPAHVIMQRKQLLNIKARAEES
jgi:hypothetical protein